MKTLLLFLTLILLLTCCRNISEDKPIKHDEPDYQDYSGDMFQIAIRKLFIDTMGSKERCIPLDFINHRTYELSRSKNDIPDRFLNFLREYNKDDYQIGDSNDSDRICHTDVWIVGKHIFDKELVFSLLSKDTLLMVYIQGGVGTSWVVDYVEMSNDPTYYRYIGWNIYSISDLTKYLKRKDIKIKKQYNPR